MASDVKQEEVKRVSKDKKDRNLRTRALLPRHGCRFLHIRNRIRRRTLVAKYLREKQRKRRQERKKRRQLEEQLGDEAPPKEVPRTLDNRREPDETMVDPQDEEVNFDKETDEMATYFRKEREPKILMTTSEDAGYKTWRFCKEFSGLIPNCRLLSRRRASIKKVCIQAAKRKFTDIIVINDNRQKPNAMLLIHLPNGPTAFFYITGIKYRRDIKGCGEMTSHRPELIFNNFNTRLGHTLARMLASIFHFDPQFKGRRVVTFHNQRDYVFFRHHRYEFRNEKKVGLHELGPRFTLKLRSVQNGTFDSKYGEFEWLLKWREMYKNRRTFML